MTVLEKVDAAWAAGEAQDVAWAEYLAAAAGERAIGAGRPETDAARAATDAALARSRAADEAALAAHLALASAGR